MKRFLHAQTMRNTCKSGTQLGRAIAHAESKMPHLAGSTESVLTPQCSAEAALLSYANARRQMNGYDDQEDLISTQRDLASLAMASWLLRGADSGRP